jgi:hypothetical protein
MNTLGQINLSSLAGKCIEEIASKNDVNSIVEIGTWNGAGSTKCIASGMSNEDVLYSIECDKGMYELSLSLWKEKENVHIIFGKIIEESEMDNANLSNRELQWYDTDVAAMRECPNVLDSLPKKIDFLVLDGGEFSTFAEFKKLKSRSTYIFLDDTKCRKNFKTREMLLNSDDFKKLQDNQEERNGWSLFRRVV